MIRRSATVAVAVTLQQLASGKTSGFTEDQELVLGALRRSAKSLNYASDEDLGDYVRGLSEGQLRGVASNVKGIFHEMLVKRAENLDDDGISAAIFAQTNHPGADLEFQIDGTVIREVQLKAVQDPASIIEHFSRYPDIDVMATTEVYNRLAETYGEKLASSEFSNEEITAQTRDALEELAGESLGDLFRDGIVTSVLVSGALQAKAALKGESVTPRQLREVLELAGIGAATATTVDTLLNLA
ncbi:hypothetical protein [Roseovarius sp.]|uniref:hypothetical protein n=1 Tax=Roseovarius sp. TaxID=1486281 RepID=UPI003A97DFDB